MENKNETINLNFTDDLDEAKNLDNLSKKILLVYPWIMVIWATISNVLSFIVLTRPKLRKSSTFFYLSCLCISDLIQVYTFCVNFIAKYQFDTELQLKSVVYCKIFAFLIYFLPQFSACTCAAVSIDRVVCVLFSVRSKYQTAARRWNTPDRAFKIMIILFILLFVLNFYFFLFPIPQEELSSITSNEYIIEEINIIYCSFEHGEGFQEFLKYWTIIDLSVNVLIPFTIMIICSVIIVIGIVNSTKNISIKRNNAKKKKTNPEPLLSKLKSASLRAEKISGHFKSVRENTSSPKLKSEQNSQVSFTRRLSTTLYGTVSSKARNVSVMLTINNFMFISLTLPIVVCLFRISEIGYKNLDLVRKAKVNLVKLICIILMNTNCTVNIFLYSLMASEFRRQLYHVLKNFFFFQNFTSPNSSQAKQSSKSKSVNKATFYLSNGDKIESSAIKITNYES